MAHLLAHVDRSSLRVLPAGTEYGFALSSSQRHWDLPMGTARSELREGVVLRADLTIAFVDVVESMLHVEEGEGIAVQRMRELLQRASECVVPFYRGQLVEQRGDGLLLRFAQPRDAVECAKALHALAAEEAANNPGCRPLQLRAGLHTGSVILDGGAVFGASVNLAARIAALANPEETLLSATTRGHLAPGLDEDAVDMGDCHLKHVPDPVRLYRAHAPTPPLPLALDSGIRSRMKMRPTLVVMPTLDARYPRQRHRPIAEVDIATDQITKQLSQSALLHVISPLSSQAFRGRNDIDLAAVYTKLRADYVLESTLTRADSRRGSGQVLSLLATLWRAGTDEPIWSESQNGTRQDLLSADSELLGSVVRAVGMRILRLEQHAARAAPHMPTLASHTLHLNAVDLLHRFDAHEFNRARQMLEALRDRAPRHPDPLAWLARWHVFRIVQGWSANRIQDGTIALDFSHRALDRDPGSALALTMAGSVYAGVKRDPETALSYYQQALSFNPNDSLAWLMSGAAQGFLVERPTAISSSQTALGLAPLDPTRHFYDSLAASAYLAAGEPQHAIALADRSIQGCIKHGSSYRTKAIAQVLLGQVDDARITVSQLLIAEPQASVAAFWARGIPENEQNRRFAQALSDAGLPDK